MERNNQVYKKKIHYNKNTKIESMNVDNKTSKIKY